MLSGIEKRVVTNHILARLESTREQSEPWPHHVFEGFFPLSFYQLLKGNFPFSSQSWKTLSHPDNQSGARQVIYLRETEDIPLEGQQKELWRDLYEIINTKVADSLLKKYQLTEYKDLTSAEVQIIKDGTGYKISPHCDTFKHKRHKLLTLLIYFPSSEDLNGYGTELYQKRLLGGFKEIKRAPFTDNTALLFQPTYNKTWHGVSQITKAVPARTSLQIFFKLKNSNSK